jgi:sulfur carrier protein
MTVQSETQSVTVNGEDRDVPVGYARTSVLRDLDVHPDYASGVAVAINNEVIPREQWGDVTLDDGDTVEVIQAQQGG